MTEQTTTEDEPILPDGAEEALPSQDQGDSAALAAQEQKNSQPQGEEEASLPEQVDDDKLKSFAKGLGIEDVSELSERELKLLKVAKDNQAEYQRNAQKASELEKSISGSTKRALGTQPGTDDDVVGNLQSTVNSLLIKDQVNTFFSKEGVDTSMRPVMAEMVKNDPALGALVENGYLGLESLYNMARGSKADSIKQEGGKQALQQLANKQVAKAVPGSATTSAYSASGKKDAFEEGFDSI